MNKSIVIKIAAAAVLGTAVFVAPAIAQKKYDVGATDTEIKIGQTMPFSGPASAVSLGSGSR